MNTLSNETNEPVELADQLVDLGLHEVLGDQSPPDLSEQILARWKDSSLEQQESTTVTRAWKNRLGSSKILRLLALAAGFLIICLLAERPLHQFAASEEAARRAATINNGRQIGLAAHNFETALQEFPSDRWGFKTKIQAPIKTRTETRTRTIAVDGKQQLQNYTVQVPYTENAESYYERDTNGDGDRDSVAGGVIVDGSASMGGAIAIAEGAIVGGAIASADGRFESDAASRKIRYNAHLQIVVDQFDGVADKLNLLVKNHNGFVASTSLGQLRGEQRSGNWTVRVPVDQYDAFLSSAGEIGVLDSRNETAADVTANYVDLEARIANKQKLEKRIVELLERPDDELKHVIEVERELARVRQEVERMQGQLRVMADQTSLATVNIYVREERDYVPPTAPTVLGRIGNAWSNSMTRTGNFFTNLAVWLVSMIVPIVGCILLALLLFVAFRRFWPRRSSQ